MAPEIAHSFVWALVRRQHGVIAHRQLIELGFSVDAIRHRLGSGRLFRIFTGVYAVGRREVTQAGLWMAAVLACAADAMLSHESAAQLWGIRPWRRGPIDVSVPSHRSPRRKGIRVHRRQDTGEPRRTLNIPLTDPATTIIDIAPSLTQAQLERAIDEADKLELASPRDLREATDEAAGARGAGKLRELLDERTFVLTTTELERLFVPLAHRAGLSKPESQAMVNGFEVDFYFPVEAIVVETDGGRYHRTPSQQRRDRIRDHQHAAAGLLPVRFTHGQVRHEPDYVADTLRRLRSVR